MLSQFYYISIEGRFWRQFVGSTFQKYAGRSNGLVGRAFEFGSGHPGSILCLWITLCFLSRRIQIWITVLTLAASHC